MSLASAKAAAEQLRTALLDHGVRRVSIELQPGVGRPADQWHCKTFVRGMGHHIVSRPSQGLNPGLGLVKRGRVGANPLQGPLCNGYGGYDLVARIITLSWANHPGAGGPWTVPRWGTVPRDNGRPYIFGWEFEGGLEPYRDDMHDFMARCGAGTLDWLGNAPLECWGEHGHPWAEGRKIDRLGYTAASGRARIAAVRTTTTTTEDDDMPTLDEIRGLLREELVTQVINRQVSGTRELWQVLDDLNSRDPRVNPIAQAVVDRPVAGDVPVWQVLAGLYGRTAVDAAAVAELLRPAILASMAEVGAGATVEQLADELAARLTA